MRFCALLVHLVVAINIRRDALPGATVAALLGALILPLPIAEAGTIGYWRFEDLPGFLVDSGSNHLNLGTSGTAPVQYTLLDSGDGSKFHDPIPQTGAANAKAANFGGSGGRYFSHADTDAFTVTDFTIEAYIHKKSDTTTTQYIASQWGGGATSRSWAFFVFGSNGAGSTTPYDLAILLSDTGTDSNIIASGIDIVLGKDYYVAASFDQSDTVTGVTFYVQNLSDGGAFQTVSKPHSIVSLNNSTEQFLIGYTGNWTGLLDEVRLSSGVLPPEDLLIGQITQVPEPGSFWLMAPPAIILVRVCRRRRAAPPQAEARRGP